MTPTQLAAKCESIGRNCEFGYYQRELGLEPVSLLRWAGAPTEGLIAALDSGFDGLMETATGTDSDGEWWLTCDRYRITFHSGERVSEVSAEDATNRVRKRLRWLAAKLMDDIRASEKVMVYSSADFRNAWDAEPLIAAVRRISVCPLLIAVEFDGAGRDVYQGWPGVWIAEVPRLTPMGGANMLDVGTWERVMAEFGRCFEVAT